MKKLMNKLMGKVNDRICNFDLCVAFIVVALVTIDVVKIYNEPKASAHAEDRLVQPILEDQ